MRTTLTIDDDVAERLRRHVRRTGRAYKQLVNEALRRGLDALSREPKAAPFRVKARKMGPRPGLNFDNVGELLERLEGPFHK